MIKINIKNDRIFLLIIATLIILKLSLLSAHDLLAIHAPHDDYLFINLAYYILNGEWLGEYNLMTLIKGPGYPVFIALSYLLGIPLLMAQRLFYSVVCVVVIYAIKPIIRNRIFLLFIFTFLLLSPFSFAYPDLSRTFRLGIYSSSVLLIFACLIGLYTRYDHSFKKIVCWSVCCGFSISIFWYTREESIFIIPSLLLFLLFYIWKIKLKFIRKLIIVTIPLGIWMLTTLVILLLNSHYYGVSITNELKSDEFTSAYGGLLNIKTDDWKQYTPVSKQALKKAYEVSPTLKTIKNQIDSSKGWPDCFFIWTLREAANITGHHQNLQKALLFYRKIGDELKQACDNGKIDCLKRGAALRPPWRQEYNKQILPTFWYLIKKAVGFGYFSANLKKDGYYIMSGGPFEAMIKFKYVTKETLVPSRMDGFSNYPKFHTTINKEKARILNDIGKFYQNVTPVLFTLGLMLNIFLLIHSIYKRQFCFNIYMCLVILSSIFACIGMLTFVKITLWSVPRPLHTVYPLVLLYIAFTVSSGYDYFNQSKRSEQALSNRIK